MFSLGRKEYGRLGIGEVTTEQSELCLVKALSDKKCRFINSGTAVSFAITDDGEGRGGEGGGGRAEEEGRVGDGGQRQRGRGKRAEKGGEEGNKKAGLIVFITAFLAQMVMPACRCTVACHRAHCRIWPSGVIFYLFTCKKNKKSHQF